MNPITREEQYLNRLTGEEGIIPDKPVTREEQYFARLCGGDNVIPDKPVTRREQYLATLCGEDVITPTKPVTRIEQYMAFASGESESKPAKPITREEMYWDKYQGGDVPEEKTIAFTDIITVTDALARAAVDLQTEITATQNLNGYEYPWVGGAGKNKFNPSEAQNNKWINSDTGEIQNVNGFWVTGYIPVKSGDMVRSTAKGSVRSCFYNTDKTQFSYVPYAGGTGAGITAPYDGFVVLAATQTQIPFGGEMTVTIDNADITYQPYSNICPITGWTGAEVVRTGKNLLPNLTGQRTNESIFIGQINGLTYPFHMQSGVTYCVSFVADGTSPSVYFEENGGTKQLWGASGSAYTPSKDMDVQLWVYANGLTSVRDAQIELGSTATEYEPYEGDTFNTELGRTVYGGTLDLTTGELTLTHAYVDLGDLTWTKFNNVFEATINDKKNGATNFITTSYRTVEKAFTVLENGETTSTNRFPVPSIFIKDERVITPQDFKTLVTGQKMVYELAIPQTISLTPTEVMMLENNNTIWADSGRVQLTYLSKAAERVQLMNASLKANTLKLSKGAVKK